MYVCQIWDTAGQERFRSITRAYYRDAEGRYLDGQSVVVIAKKYDISCPGLGMKCTLAGQCTVQVLRQKTFYLKLTSKVLHKIPIEINVYFMLDF